MNENFKTINYKGTEVTVSKYGEVYWDGNRYGCCKFYKY